MKYAGLGRTGISVSRIVLGSWSFGGSNWGGAPDENACVATVRKAIDCGVNAVDTAPFYSAGYSETVIGKALKGRRDRMMIFTKCGLVAEGGRVSISLKPDSIRREVELSLRRLDTDYIDLYQTHWPDKHTAPEETYAELARLREEGKIRHIGVCNVDKALLEKIIPLCGPVSVQNEYSLLKRDAEKSVIPFCAANGLSFIAYGPLAGGILSGKHKTPPVLRKDDARSFFYRFYKGPGFETASRAVELLKSGAAGHPVADAALNWALSTPGVTAVLSGARTPEQAQANAASQDWDLEPGAAAAISAFS